METWILIGIGLLIVGFILIGIEMVLPGFSAPGISGIICLVAGLDFGIVREGTVIFAVANGVLINLFLPHVEKLFTAVENLCGVSKAIA